MRIGLGYDVYKLIEDRKFIIGGVEILYDKGLLGYFDVDVLIYVIMDFILGVLVLGDIGKYFLDIDEEYKGVDSMKLLEYVYNLIISKGYKIGNIDSIIIV